MSPDPARTFLLDGRAVPFRDGQTVLAAALTAGIYIPHLCSDPDCPPASACRLCTVLVDGWPAAACAQPAAAGQVVESDTLELRELRLGLVQLLLAEGNHACPACEKSGDCKLQALAALLGLQANPFPPGLRRRGLDASHPQVLLDRDRCILCGLCVRLSREVDRTGVFAFTGRGMGMTVGVDAPSGLLRDSRVGPEDAAVRRCPVGALLVRGEAWRCPPGERTYDRQSLAEMVLAQVQAWKGGRHGP